MKILADIVVILHLAFIAFVVLGGLLVLRRPRWAWVHVPCALWGCVVELTGWYCPLTPLEMKLRHAAGDAGYEGSFIGHYLLPLIYPPGLTRGAQLVLAGVVVALNVAIYARVVARRRR